MRGLNLGNLLKSRAEAGPEKVFLYYGDEEITYREIVGYTNKCSNFFRELGIGVNDRVALMFSNCPEFLYCWFGLAGLGAMEVAVNTQNKGESLLHQVKFFNCRGIVVEDQFMPALQELSDRLEFLEFIIVVNRGKEEVVWPGSQRIFDFHDLFEKSTNCDPGDIKIPPGHPLSILFTSGTTGVSKGVINSHEAYRACGLDMARVLGITADDRIYVFLPLFHGNPQMMGVMTTLAAGAGMVLGKKFSASKFLDEVNRYQATVFTYVGSVLAILDKQPERENERDNPLRLCFGGGAPLKIWESLQKRYGMEIVEAYGQIEAGCITTVNLPGDIKMGSIGRPRDNLEVKVFNEVDEALPPGQTGEIVVRPLKPFIIYNGYDGMPEETLKSSQNLWHHTGDLAWYDEDNNFYFAGRKKHVIRNKGENISPLEIEDVLNAHPKILESAAVGVPDDIAEEEIKACIVLKTGETMLPEEVISLCREKLPEFMVPRFVEFFEEFEKTASEKIQVFKLQETGRSKAWDRLAGR